MSSFTAAPEHVLQEFIKRTARESAFSHLEFLDGSPVSEEPLVGFADAYDPLIAQFKQAVSTSHLSPLEAWQKDYSGTEKPQPLSIIAWVLPFTETIRKSNQGPHVPSRHWAHGRLYIEAISNEIRDKLVAFLKEMGHRAAAPARASYFGVDWNAPNGPVSTWSERHYCYTAGLGTFGLNRGLITSKGMAMRCGSVVADIALTPTPRKASHTADCPFLETGGCGDCIARCPANAITPEGKDNVKCYQYLFETIGPTINSFVTQEAIDKAQSATAGRLGICGLCQTHVPCEDRIPPPELFQPRASEST